MPRSMKRVVLVTGTRRDTRRGEVSSYLDAFLPDVIIVGDATGVDAEAVAWGKGKVDVCQWHAPWKTLGGKAGPHRNSALAATLAWFEGSGHWARCAAFPDEHSRGTFDCVSQLRPFIRVDWPGCEKWEEMYRKWKAEKVSVPG